MIQPFRLTLTIAGFMAGISAQPAGTTGGVRIIETSDTGRVIYRVIECTDPSLSASECHAREQRLLNGRIQDQWIEAAVKRYGIVPTAEEEAITQQKLAAEATHFAEAGAHFHALAVAALEIRRGKERAELLPELAKQGITPNELDWEVAHVLTIAEAERAAAMDYVADNERSLRAYHTRQFDLQHLRELLIKRSVSERKSLEAAEEELWSEIAESIHTRMIDPAFQIPDKKGILVGPDQRNVDRVQVRSSQGVTSTAISKAVVTPAISADAQLGQASKLWQQMGRTPLPERLDLIAQTFGNLDLVHRQWPNNKRAIVRSGIMQADLAAELGALPKTIDALLLALTAASKTDQEPAVEWRLGKAYDESGNPAEAEKHFLNAERTMRSSHLNRIESQNVLNTSGLFYSRQGKPAEAIRRLHEEQLLPGQDAVGKAVLQLSVVKEAVKLSKEESAKELADLDSLIDQAQRTNPGHDDATLISDVQKDAKRIHDQTKQ
jgi:tetratricopeptide (TPR) repeat protein